MRTKHLMLFSVQIVLLILLCTPKTLLAATVEFNVPRDFPTIQAAITQAAANLASQPTGTTYSILVEPGTYAGFTLQSSIDVIGRETARTIINGQGTGPAVIAANVNNVRLTNFTITNATIGVQVTSNAAPTIRNNVFMVGMLGTAIQVLGAPSTSVINNTFFRNGIAISRDSDISIVNNIFANNTTNISQGNLLAVAGIDHNDFFPTPTVTEPVGTNSIPNLSVPISDPLFVNLSPTTQHDFDFHLTELSPCIGAGSTVNGSNSVGGTPTDMGAYGGPNADTIPYFVSIDPLSSSASTTDASISLSWSANSSYVVTNTDPAKQGGYNVYYHLTSEPTTTLQLDSTVTSTVITGLSTTIAPPAAPILAVGFADQALLLSWTPVPTATKYQITYTSLATGITTTINDVTTNSFKLGGLTNGLDYTITVKAFAQPRYHITVTAVDFVARANPGVGTPGIAHESIFSDESVFTLGAAVPGPDSDPVTAFPETIGFVPNLPNKGCFIATAAYGYYDAPQVQALRDFRDRFLMTNTAGRAFVMWYYEYGPIGAAVMNEHPWLKPVVRTALMPAVGGALFLTRTSLAVQLAVLFCITLLVTLLVLRKKAFVRGGSR